MRIDINKILDESLSDRVEFTTQQVISRYGMTHIYLQKLELAEYLHPRKDVYGTTFWLREELDLISHDPDSFISDWVSDLEACRILDCHRSILDQLELALNPVYRSGVRFWDKKAIQSLIDTYEVDE